jgi:WD40 repeat protein
MVMDAQAIAEQEQHESHNGVTASISPAAENHDEMQLDKPDAEQEETKQGYKALFTLQGHKRSVSSLAISPDGQQLVSSGVDGLLKIWSLATGASIATLDAALASDEEDETARLRLGVSDVAWSKDGQYLVSGGDDCIVRIWDAARVSLSEKARKHCTSYKVTSFRSTRSSANSLAILRTSSASTFIQILL